LIHYFELSAGPVKLRDLRPNLFSREDAIYDRARTYRCPLNLGFLGRSDSALGLELENVSAKALV
jgi:hypothetical protein